MLRCLLLLLVLAGGAWAQSPEATPEAAPTSTDALIELLKDDAARQELIDRLEAATATPEQAEGDPATAPAEGDPVTTPAEGDPVTTPAAEEEGAFDTTARSLGRRIAEFTQDGAGEIAAQVADLATRLQRLPQTLSNLGDAVEPGVVLDALRDLAFVIATTTGLLMLLRILARRVSRGLAAQARGASWLRRALLQVAFSLTNIVVVVMAWAAGYTLTVSLYDGFGTIAFRQSAYLNAFLTVGLAKVAGRAVLSPQFHDLRLIGLSDVAAKRFWSWFNTVALVLGYGILLAVPITQRGVGYFAGAALETAIGAILVIYTAIRVIRSRRDIAGWIHREAGDDDQTDAMNTPPLARLAELWWLPVMAYLAVVLVIVLTRPGGVLLPLLQASALVVATIVGGMMAGDFLTKSARH
ncbi:MAG: hypothetical protein AAFV62_05665, partial [Pseudomonadota bacterium]